MIHMARRDHVAVEAFVRWATAQEPIERIVMVTHTLPHRALLAWGVYPPPGHEGAMAGYGNSLMMNVPKLDACKKISHWLCGHSHAPMDIQVDGIRYINWARGDKARRVPGYRPKEIQIPATAHKRASH
jgi:hypothetical protein